MRGPSRPIAVDLYRASSSCGSRAVSSPSSGNAASLEFQNDRPRVRFSRRGGLGERQASQVELDSPLRFLRSEGVESLGGTVLLEVLEHRLPADRVSSSEYGDPFASTVSVGEGGGLLGGQRCSHLPRFASNRSPSVRFPPSLDLFSRTVDASGCPRNQGFQGSAGC